MLHADPAIRLSRRRDGYLPIESPSLIGEGVTCALAGVDGSVPRHRGPHSRSKRRCGGPRR